MQWTTGDASEGVDGLGGNAARVGFSAIDSVNIFNVSESGTAEIINITQTSNIHMPGVWMFHVSSGGMYICMYVCMYVCKNAIANLHTVIL